MAKLFKEQSITTVFAQRYQDITSAVSKIDNSILNRDLNREAQQFSDSFQLKELIIDFEKGRSVNVEMVNLSGSQFPGDYDVRRDKSYSCAKVIYSFKVESGHPGIITKQPKGYSFQYDFDVEIEHNRFSIGYQTLFSHIELSEAVQEEVKSAMSKIISEAKNCLDYLNSNIKDFNGGLYEFALGLLSKRKAELQKINELKNNLNDF